MISQLLKEEVQEFIKDHRNDDPLQLALKAKKYPGLPIQLISQQIQSWQKAKSKLPHFAQCEGIIYPPPLSLEQSSSQFTAQFKSSLFSGKTFVDLTGGFGIDSYYFSKRFEKAFYVERNPELCEIVRHNFQTLGVENITIFNEDAEAFLNHSDEVDLIYIDPARRGIANQKLYMLSDCEPDILNLKPLLLQKGKQVLIKTSPMLDIEEALGSLVDVVKVWVVAVDNECKEVLYLLSSGNHKNEIMIECVNLKKDGKEEVFTFYKKEEQNAEVIYGEIQNYLYEPNAAILKAGAFKVVSQKFQLQKLHVNSHLYTSKQLVNDFPGRVFKIVDATSFNKKEVLKSLNEKKANISIRNFPLSVREIYKKLGLKEGGNQYVFATTDIHQKLKIVITEKV